jgi:hypothetical protein
MGELRNHDPDLAQITASNLGSCVPNERIAGIAIVDGANAATITRRADDLLGLFDSVAHGLFTEHVETG